MGIFTKWVTTHSKLVVILFIVVALVCAVMQFGVSVNYNIVDYLPDSAASTKALGVMTDEFTQAVPNGRVMVNGVTVQQALEYKRALMALDGVSDVTWLDDVVDLRTPLEMADTELVESYYKDGRALISVTVSGDASAVTQTIYDLIGPDNAFSGSAASNAALQNTTTTETSNAMLILIPVVVLILLLSTTSWIEPLLFFAAIGVSVLMNMGTNLFFGKISFITHAISPILQLAVSLDYAIFLLHAFEDYRKKTDSLTEAMRLAMRRAFSSVAASAATTLFGFMALMFMQFKIGSDLGLVLAKGIVLSFVSVMTFLPALTLCLCKLLDKTRHRKLLPAFKAVGRAVPRLRVPALVLVLLIIVPCFLAQQRSEFIYGSDGLNGVARSGRDDAAVTEVFGASNSIVLLVGRGDVAREKMLADDCADLPHVTQVLSYAGTVGTTIPGEFLDSGITDQFYSARYSRLILYTDTASEGDEAFALVERVLDTAEAHYGSDYYALGSSVNLWDMKNVVQRDNSIVNFIAIAAILLVLIVTFRSVTLPVILLMTIESAIWINLAVPYFTATPLCYIGYLVISTVQLGATVDYAILLTDHYRENRRSMPKRSAIRATLDRVFSSILVSGAILSLAGFTLGLSSSNPIVKDMGMLLGRGTILSMLLVVFFLPAALVLLDKAVAKTTIGARFAPNSNDDDMEVKS